MTREEGAAESGAPARPARGKGAPPSAEAPTLASLLAPLRAMDECTRPFGAQNLLQCADLLERVQDLLANRRSPEEETLEDQERVLLLHLRAYFAGVSATPAIVHGDLLEPELVASGICAPFVAPGPGGAARFGVPSKLSPDIVCETASELLRMSAAALICLYVYLNYRQGPGSLPPDEALLVFSTIVISSCAEPANAAALDAQLAQLGAPPGWGCSQVRWLMHYVRGLVLHHMGGVAHLLGQPQRQAQLYGAQQRDAQALVKALPDHPLGYSLFARAAMSFQQMPLAAAFLARGLDAARTAGDDAGVAAMAFQRAVALVLGGGSGVDGAFDGAEVLELQAAGEAARASVLSWFPAPWRPQASDGEPDRTLLATKLLPLWVARARGGGGAATAGDGAGGSGVGSSPSPAASPSASPDAGSPASASAGESSEEGEAEGGQGTGNDAASEGGSEGEGGGAADAAAQRGSAAVCGAPPVPELSAEEVEAALLAGGSACAALRGLLYVSKPPSAIPPGAIQLPEGGEEAQAHAQAQKQQQQHKQAAHRTQRNGGASGGKANASGSTGSSGKGGST